jgi:hypothetical protein
MRNETIFVVTKKQGTEPPLAFGSIKAIFDTLGEAAIGVPIRSVWGRISSGNPVKTERLTIHKTKIVRRRQK